MKKEYCCKRGEDEESYWGTNHHGNFMGQRKSCPRLKGPERIKKEICWLCKMTSCKGWWEVANSKTIWGEKRGQTMTCCHIVNCWEEVWNSRRVFDCLVSALKASVTTETREKMRKERKCPRRTNRILWLEVEHTLSRNWALSEIQTQQNPNLQSINST